MAIGRTLASRLRTSVAVFARNEDGGATIWNLTWLLGFAIMLGLAVDTTDGRRHQTILQSTSDVASLAGVLELPNPYDPEVSGYRGLNGYPEVHDMALEYADKNMLRRIHGDYMQNDDIFIGHWDEDNRNFIWGEDFEDPEEYPVNAVKVFIGRNDENSNNVRTSYLSLIGLDRWQINTAAVAQADAPDCLLHGFMAQDEICVRSGNTFDMETCLHGEQGLNFRNGNTYLRETYATHGENYNNSIDDSNYPDLSTGMDASVKIPIVDEIFTITQGLLEGRATALKYNRTSGDLHDDSSWTEAPELDDPTEMEKIFPIEVHELQLTNQDLEITGTIDPNGAWWQGAHDFDVASVGALVGIGHHSVDHTDGGGGDGGGGGGGGGGLSSGCDQGASAPTRYEQNEVNVGMAALQGALSIAQVVTSTNDIEANQLYWHDGGPSQKITLSGTVRNLALITTSPVDIATNAVIESSLIISLHKIQAIHIGSGATIGAADLCNDGGGVMLIGLGTIDGASNVEFNGPVLASGGNIHFGAQADGFNGVATYAKGNISFTSNSTLKTYSDDCKAQATIEDEHLIYKLVE